MRYSNFVWAKIPRAGLANKLLVLSKAMIFAKLNKLPLITTNLVSFHLGPILRRERSIRFYNGYFNQDSLIKRLKIRLLALFDKSPTINPDIKILGEQSKEKSTLYVFKDFMFWMHFFDQIRDYRHWVKPFLLETLIKVDLIKEANRKKAPHIAVHVRLGDFKKLENKEEFKALDAWCIRTPIEYFVEAINKIRQEAADCIPVTLFTDGTREEVKEILELPEIHLSEESKDIMDFLMISKSKVILPSPSSTFSLLAAYLSEAVIFHHPDFYMRNIRPNSVNDIVYEGPINLDQENWSQDLIEQLR